MPRLRIRDATNVLRTITRVRMRDAGGTLRTINRIRMRDAAGVLRTVFQYFSVALSASFVNGSSSGAAASGSVTTGNVTATVSGGVAPYTYAWTFVSGEASITPGSPAAATTNFGGTMDTGTFQAIYHLTVTDANGLTVGADVTAQCRWIDTR